MSLMIDSPDIRPALATRGVDVTSPHVSSLREKVLEYRFLAELTSFLLLRGIPFDVLRGDVDAQGYDLVIEADGVTRHIQLKAMHASGKRADVSVNLNLMAKPSGCIIWMCYDTATLAIGPFRWFGGLRRAPLPDPGERVARHSKGNTDGTKPPRGDHRLITRSQFALITSMEALVERLFG